MPEDLLLEVETTPAVAASLENIEDLERIAMRELDRAVQGMKGSVQVFENAWRHIVLDVAKGQTSQVQAARARLLTAFEKRLSLLRQTHALATRFRKLERSDVPDPAVLLPEIAGMERLKATVFDRWRGPEDLEDLAARDYPLTTAELEQVGPRCRPPQ